MIALLKATYAGFARHKSPWLAAAMSYFAVFAVAPLVIVLIEIAALAVGNDATARKEVYAYIAQHASGSSGTAIRGMVDATLSQRREGIIAQAVGWTVFVFAAVGLFGSLRDALDTIWDVTPQSKGFIGVICQEAVSFFVMLGVALLLMISVVASAALSAAPGSKVIVFFVSFAVITAAFAVLFRFLPAATIEWRDVWAGAALTSLLFVLGQFLLAWYLGRAGTASIFGAAGALVIFLMWVNYSAQIVLFGAEFTHEYASLRRRA
ncbi:MAG TPA: YihY/virulence factor BrkB family protein [Candidatus Rubrimentiphilum sp.]|nr:YihY/virulence factor BrkB family protein [Candidatus Rubrimentiphilum sp.]